MKDWDLTLFSGTRNDPSGRYAYGLRDNLLLGTPRLYHYVIIADLVLRFSWAWRVLPGLSWLAETESGLFMLMFLEVARRWMWVFFRVEAEHRTYHLTTLPQLFLGHSCPMKPPELAREHIHTVMPVLLFPKLGP